MTLFVPEYTLVARPQKNIAATQRSKTRNVEAENEPYTNQIPTSISVSMPAETRRTFGLSYRLGRVKQLLLPFSEVEEARPCFVEVQWEKIIHIAH